MRLSGIDYFRNTAKSEFYRINIAAKLCLSGYLVGYYSPLLKWGHVHVAIAHFRKWALNAAFCGWAPS